MKQYKRIQNREINIEKDNDLGRSFQLATTSKISANSLNLHEINSEVLSDFTDDFEMTVSMLIGEVEQKRTIRFRKIEDLETYITAIDVDYDREDVIFTGWLFKLSTPHLNMVSRSQYGRRTDFEQKIVEYINKICYIPTSVNCSMKCFNHPTVKDCTEGFLT